MLIIFVQVFVKSKFCFEISKPFQNQNKKFKLLFTITNSKESLNQTIGNLKNKN